MKNTVKVVDKWLLFGIAYYWLEGMFHLLTNGGWAWWGMSVIGGLCGLLIGAMNQFPRFYNMRMWKQCLIGTAIILSIEFISGCIVNLWWGLGVWDYSQLPLNLMGQVCVPFGILWFLLVPVAIWLEDAMRAKFWGEGQYYTLVSLYIDLFRGR